MSKEMAVTVRAMHTALLCCLGFMGGKADTLPPVNTSSKINVGILIMPGIFISEATIPFDVYKHVSASKMDTFFVAEDTSPVNTYYGTQLKPDYRFDDHPSIDVLVVPSGIGSHYDFLLQWYSGSYVDGNIVGKTNKEKDVTYYGNVTALVDWVKSTANSAAIVTSHCWGAFTLADAGLLDGETVTTFPGYTQKLIEHAPDIKAVVDDERFVVSGKFVTSNGGLAAFEACLYVVRHLFGDDDADKIVAGLVYSPHNVDHSKLDSYLVSPPKGVKPSGELPTKNVGILLTDGAFISEPVGPWDVYVHMTSMNAFFVAEDMNPKSTYYGATLYPDYTFTDSPPVDVLVVPSGIGSHYTFLTKWYEGQESGGVYSGSTTKGVSVTYYGNESALIAWVKNVSETAEYVTSHCWGAFTLADAGLLDGKTVTTFPGYEGDLETNYPAIGKVVRGHRIVKDGNVITSNGGVAAYEAANYVVKLIYGDYYAKQVAGGLVYSKDNYDVMNKVYDAEGDKRGKKDDEKDKDASGCPAPCVLPLLAALLGVGHLLV